MRASVGHLRRPNLREGHVQIVTLGKEISFSADQIASMRLVVIKKFTYGLYVVRTVVEHYAPPVRRTQRDSA